MRHTRAKAQHAAARAENAVTAFIAFSLGFLFNIMKPRCDEAKVRECRALRPVCGRR